MDVHYKSTQHFLQEINLDVETYMDALKILQRGPKCNFEVKPTRCFYKCMQSGHFVFMERNVDLQYVINEIATVKYVCSYMTKGEKGMGETLKRVAKEY